GAFRPATHWRVQHVHAARGQHVVDAANEQRRVGRVIDVQRALAHPFEDSLRTERDLLHLLRTRQTGGNDLDAAATAAGGPTQVARRARSDAAASRRMSWTSSGWPARRSCPAIGLPMLPTPMKPTFMAWGAL